MHEYVFVLGGENEQPRKSPPTPSTIFLRTLSMLLRLLKDTDSQHVVTIFDFATGQRHHIVRPHLPTHLAWETLPLPLNPVSGGVPLVWDYLAKVPLRGSVRAIEFICHSDFNSLAVNGSFRPYRTSRLNQKNPRETRLLIRRKLAADCHIKIWGCASYDMRDAWRWLGWSHEPFTGARAQESGTSYESQLPPGLQMKTPVRALVGHFGTVLKMRMERKKIPTHLQRKHALIQKYARNLHREAFIKRGPTVSTYYTHFTFPAVGLSEFLGKPVYAPPWGLPSDTKKVSDLGLHPPIPADLRHSIYAKYLFKVLIPTRTTHMDRFYDVFFSFTRESKMQVPCYSFLYHKLLTRRIFCYDYSKLKNLRIAADWAPEETEEALALLYPDTDAYPVDLFEYPKDYPVDLFEYPETYPS